MNFLTKHWRKFILAAFASFWAGCDDDSSSAQYPPTEYGCPQNICDDSAPNSSESIEPGSSAKATSSATSASESSSSETVSSSSESKLFRLAADTTVSCDSIHYFEEREVCDDPAADCYATKNKLATPSTLSEKETSDDQQTLLNCQFDNFVAVYGAPSCYGIPAPAIKYSCDNGRIYTDSYYREKDGLIYTTQEYSEKFPANTSGPATTCKHENELHFKDLFNEVKQDMYQELLQELDSDGNVLTAEKRATLESFLDRDNKTLTVKTFDRNNTYNDEDLLKIYNEIGFDGIVFKTRTCSDGTEEETELYKERAGKIRSYIQGLIDNAWDKNS